MSASPRGAGGAAGRPAVGRLLQSPAVAILVAWAFAVAQPFYAVLGESSALFVAHRATPLEIVAVTVVVSLVAPLVLVGLWAAVRRVAGERAGDWTATVLVGALAAVATAAPVAERGAVGTPGAVAIAVAVGVAVGLVYRRWRRARDLFAVALPAVVVFPAVFLLATPVAALLRPAAPVATRQGAASPVPVVIVVFDMLPVAALVTPDGDVDGALFPAFARLAGESVWLRHTAAVESMTHLSIPTLLTGRASDPRAVSTYETYPDNLFTLLGRPGRTHVLESTTQLCPPALCGLRDARRPGAEIFAADLAVVAAHVLLPPGWRGGLPAVDDAWVDFAGLGDVASTPDDRDPERPQHAERAALRADVREDQMARLATFLDDLPRNDGGSLSYLHLSLPHGPFLYLADGRRYLPPGGVDGLRLGQPEGFVTRRRQKVWGDDAELVRLAYQRLLLQVAFADRLLGRILARLTEAGLYDRALLVVTSDHGQTYLPGRRLRHLRDAETRRVPLFVKLPHQRGRRVIDEPATLLDVVPTVAALLGVPVDWPHAGTARIGPDVVRAVTADDAAGEPPPLPGKSDLRPLLERKARWVGGLADPFVSSWRPDLHGRLVADLPPAPPRAGASARLDLAESLARPTDIVPAYLTGTLTGASDRRVTPDLAIAIDGVVRATCRAYRDDGELRFAALLPAAAVDSPPHEWGVYEVVGAGPRPRLRLLASGGGGADPG